MRPLYSTATPIALELMRMFPKAAMEISSSGKGLHLFFSYKGSAPPHARKNKKLNIELYTVRQFIALTGIHANGDVATDYTEELHKAIEIYFPKTVAVETNNGNIAQQWADQVAKIFHSDCDGDREDDKLIERMLNSKSPRAIFGDKASLKDLWEGNVEALVKAYPDASHESGYDESSADAALAFHLAFWTGKDADRTLRLMQSSGLKREKWDRDDYLPRTILNAFSVQQSVYIKSEKTQLISACQPEPLPELPAVLPFDYSYLPDGLREYVCDISERMQCPPDYAAVAVYVMMATVCGRKIGIRPMKEDNWTVIPNLWGAVVGNSGMMKSPTLNECLLPLKKLAANEFDIFNNASTEYCVQENINKLQQSVNKTKARAALGKQKDADIRALLASEEINNAPILKRFITNNASYEALGELLIENPNGILVEADEIIGLLKQLDAHGQEAARSFYLTAADGDKSYTFDRIMRGKGLRIESVCVSILGGIQPGVLADYVSKAVNGSAGADGLLQRFGLMVYPDISLDWKEIDRPPNKIARINVFMLVERINGLNSSDIGALIDSYGGVPFLRFTDAAQRLFSRWRGILEKRLRSGEEHPAIISHLSKYRKLIPSLALLNHLCDSGIGAVSEAALQRAIAYGQYLESHARRIYSYATTPEIDAAKTVLKRLAAGKLTNPFKARDLSQKGWTGLSTPRTTQAAINILLEYGHLSKEVLADTGGRPTEIYHWHKE